MRLSHSPRPLILSLAIVFASVAPALAAGVRAEFDLSSRALMPFPTDLFTVADSSHNTGVRMNLPKPNCVTHPSDCADIDVLLCPMGTGQPRITRITRIQNQQTGII